VKLGLRRRVVLGAIGSFAIGLVLLLIAFNVALDRRLQSEASSVLDSRAAAQRANLAVAGGRLRVREAPKDASLDGAAWVFQGRNLLDPVRMPLQLRRTVVRLIPSPRPIETTTGNSRLLVQTQPVNRHVSATVVAAVSLSPYQDAQRIALIGSAVVAVALLALVVVIANRTVTAALRPIRRMTEQAATWSEQDLHRRFDLGAPHDELSELAANLDGLLGRVDESFQHEQRFSAEVAHELRAPLTRQRLAAEIALRGEGSDGEAKAALGVALREVDQMTVIIDTLVAAAQADLDPARGISTAAEIIDLLAKRLGESDGAGPTLVREGNGSADQVRVHVDVNYAVQTLLPVADNARRFTRTKTTVRCEARGAEAVFTIGDDGPGVAPDEVETIFAPGVRGRASSANGGAGLGLSLSRRLARAVGGDVVAVAGSQGGRFEVVLPTGA
jgi:signal transduction histidine kinase